VLVQNITLKMILRTHKKFRQGGKTHNTYECDWCGDEFDRHVGNTDSGGGGKHSSVSSQVKCYKCGNFIKTWE